MNERKKKPTLEQIRTLHHFDIPTLAMKAGVGTRIIYHALVLHPICRKDAEKIVAALSQHTGLELSLEHVDIVLWEEFLLLWLIRASADGQQNEYGEITDEYHFVYARDQEHAAMLACNWLEQLPHLPHHYFTACPEGFKIGDIFVPGHQQVEE